MKKKGSFKIDPKRLARLDNGLSEADAEKIITTLLFLASQSGEKIYLIINSGGGSYVGGMRLYDAIKIIPNKIIGIVIGDAFSVAALVLQACSRRLASAHSRLLVHEPANPVTVTIGPRDNPKKLASLMEAEVLEIRRKKAEAQQIILDRSGKISPEDLLTLMEKNEMLTPEKALKIGLIDEIID